MQVFLQVAGYWLVQWAQLPGSRCWSCQPAPCSLACSGSRSSASSPDRSLQGLGGWHDTETHLQVHGFPHFSCRAEESRISHLVVFQCLFWTGNSREPFQTQGKHFKGSRLKCSATRGDITFPRSQGRCEFATCTYLLSILHVLTYFSLTFPFLLWSRSPFSPTLQVTNTADPVCAPQQAKTCLYFCITAECSGIYFRRG